MCVCVCVCVCVRAHVCKYKNMTKEGIKRMRLYIVELFSKVKISGFCIKPPSRH